MGSMKGITLPRAACREWVTLAMVAKQATMAAQRLVKRDPLPKRHER